MGVKNCLGKNLLFRAEESATLLKKRDSGSVVFLRILQFLWTMASEYHNDIPRAF